MSEPGPSFNLLDEPWLPVVTSAGSFEEIGLLDLFERSGELRSIWSADALETLALHRLAVAVTLAALTAPSEPRGQRRDLAGRALAHIDDAGLPIEIVLSYLEQWRERFWLFGPEAFWQLGADEPSPVARLDPLRAVGTQPAFFDHHQDPSPASLTASEAVRRLAVGQVFSVGMGRGPGGRAFRNGLIGKLALVALPVADTVAGTLTANLVAYRSESQPEDAPVWERDRGARLARVDSQDHIPAGLLDILTWEPRAVELRADSDGRVTQAGYAMGVNAASFEALVEARRTDPWVPVGRTRTNELQPLRARAGRAAWSNSDAVLLGLLPRKEFAETHSILSGARHRARGRHALALLVGGLVPEGKNTVAGVLLSSLPLPPEALDEMPPAFLLGLERLTADARDAATAARRALGRFVREYHQTSLRRGADLGGEIWGREESAYWATGGRFFSAHVAELADGEQLEEVRGSWLQIVRDAALTAVRRGTDPYADAQGLRAAALARAHLRRHLPRLDQQEAA